MLAWQAERALRTKYYIKKKYFLSSKTTNFQEPRDIEYSNSSLLEVPFFR